MKTMYVYKTKKGFGGLLKEGIRCKVITHLFNSAKCIIQVYKSRDVYWGSLKDLTRFMD